MPKRLFGFGRAAIYGDIMYEKNKDEYILCFKDEGLPTENNGFRTHNGVMRATSKNLTGPYTTEYKHLQQTKRYAVGSSVFPLIISDA